MFLAVIILIPLVVIGACLFMASKPVPMNDDSGEYGADEGARNL